MSTTAHVRRLDRARRVIVLGVAMAMVAIACGADTSTDTTTATPASVSNTEGDSTVTKTVVPGPTAAVGVLPDGPSALRSTNHDEFPEPLVDPNQIVSGGPPPDGIPPLDHPALLRVSDALDRFEADEAVVALEINGEARAYPVQVMIWHEIVNDTVGGVPVSVTYCPLCNSAVTYDRRIRGVETTFGTSGRLFASALVMYDRATESLWTHFDGRAVVGVLTGEQLTAISSPLLAWSEFRSAYPDGMVLDPDNTGHARDYGRNPYVGYDDEGQTPFLFRGIVDDRAAAMQRVTGVAIGDVARAYALQAISGGDAQATNDALGEIPIAIFWKAGQASALEARTLFEGRDVGSVAVFSPVVDGEVLTFRSEGADFVDEQTNSVWAFNGEAVSGDLTGTSLERINHLDTFWFAWATYQPGTDLIAAP